jgi:hypothetical protein
MGVVAWTLDRTSQGKPTKTAAMLTQKNAATFDQQTQTRLMEPTYYRWQLQK